MVAVEAALKIDLKAMMAVSRDCDGAGEEERTVEGEGRGSRRREGEVATGTHCVLLLRKQTLLGQHLEPTLHGAHEAIAEVIEAGVAGGDLGDENETAQVSTDATEGPKLCPYRRQRTN